MSKCVIIGAGLSGLSMAYHLEEKYVVLESESRVGGLCRTETADGFTFDYTGHFLHIRNEKIKKLVFELMGEKLVTHERRSGIYLYGVTTPYPFQLNIYGHPPDLIKECLLGLIEATYSRADVPAHTFEDWILKTCGKGIARHFMIPYNSKIWTVHPREMTTKWMGSYVPAPNIEAALDGALRPPMKTMGYNANFYYPREGGIEALPASFLPFIRSLRLNTKVEWIDPVSRRVGAGGEAIAYDILVSTIPLKRLLQIMQHADSRIVEMAEKLRHNSVCTVNLGIDRKRLSDYHWLYFPEEKYCFYRVGFPSQLSEGMAPAGAGSLNVEISCADAHPVDEQTIVDRVIRDLKASGILRDSDRILTSKILRIPCAYVIYDREREKVLPQIQDYLQSKGIYSIGRYGNWEYSAMEDAMFQGMQTAQLINAGGKAKAANG